MLYICIQQFLSVWSVWQRGSAVVRLDTLSVAFSPEATEHVLKWATKLKQEGRGEKIRTREKKTPK